MPGKPAENHNPFENIRCLMFDLDDTLYPRESGAWDRVRVRIDQFLIEKMGFPPGDVPALRSRLFHQYGTTLRGLQIEYQVDMEDYLRFVHDAPLVDILSPDPELDQVLQAFPQHKVIFTNAYAPHAHRVMAILGVQHHFDQVIDIYNTYPYCKPEAEAFNKALAFINQAPEHCLLIDDNPANLDTAKTLGLGTISVGIHHHNGSPHIADIKHLIHLLT
ncbi:MAG: pyrimidine 5'-nucleotidase [Brevefilum sp.]|nr:pyrimidine 5'-nucleotidase [Brevefilum sp.]